MLTENKTAFRKLATLYSATPLPLIYKTNEIVKSLSLVNQIKLSFVEWCEDALGNPLISIKANEPLL